MNERQRILLETTRERDKAEALLRELLDAKTRSEKQLAELKQTDPVKQATGRSSIDAAISSTRRMIDTLSRQIDDFKRGFSEEELAFLAHAGEGDSARS
jgi:hypothetical protein